MIKKVHSVIKESKVLLSQNDRNGDADNIFTALEKNDSGNSKRNKIGSKSLLIETAVEKKPNNDEYENRLLETNKKLQLLYDTTKQLTTTLEADKIYEILYNFARQTMPCDGFLVSTFDPVRKMISYVSSWTGGEKVNVKGVPEIPLAPEGKGIQSEVIRTGNSLIVANLVDFKQNLNTYYYFDNSGKVVKKISRKNVQNQSAIFVPLKKNDLVIGVVQIFSLKLNSYTEEHKNLLATLSTHISAALVNANLYEKAQEEIAMREKAQEELAESKSKLIESNKKLQFLYNSTKELAKTLDVKKIYGNLYDFIKASMPCDSFIVSSYDKNTKLIKCVGAWRGDSWINPENLPLIPLEDEGKGNQSVVIRSGKALLLKNINVLRDQAKSKYFFDESGSVFEEIPDDAPRSTAAILVPMKIENEIAGVIQVYSYEYDAFSDEHLKLLETISTHVSSALVNANLYKKAQDEILRREKAQENLESSEAKLVSSNKQLNLLYDTAKMLASTLDVNRIYEILYDFALKAMPCDGFLVSTFDSNSKMIKFVACWTGGKQMNVGDVPEIPLAPEGKGLQSEIIRTGKPVIVDDFEDHKKNLNTYFYFDDKGKPASNYTDETDRNRSAILVPLKNDNNVIGVVQVFSYRVRAFNEEHKNLLITASTHISSALVNAKLFKKAQEEIAERKKIEEMLQLTQFSIDRASDAITWVDMNGKFTDVNDSASRLFGIEKDKFSGFYVWNLDINATKQTWIEFRNKIRKEGSNLSETEIKTGQNKTIPVEILANHIFFKEKEFIVAFVRDITERKKAEELIVLSEERYRSVYDQSTVGIAIVTLNEMKYISANKALCEMFGYSEDELRNLTVFDITVKDDMDEFFNGTNDKDGLPAGNEFRIITKHGKILWIKISGSLIKDRSGKPLYRMGIIENIDSKKKAEEALRESEEKYRSVFEQTNVGISIVTLDEWKFLSVNEAYCNMLGYTRKELLNKTVFDITHPEDALEQKRLGQASPESFVFEKRLRKISGEYIWVKVTSSIIKDKENKPLFRQAILENIDLRKKAEVELKFQEERFKALYDLSKREFSSETELMKYALEEAVRLTKSKIGYMLVLNENENDIDEFIWSETVNSSCNVKSEYSFKINGGGAWADCARSRKPVIHNELDNINNSHFPEGHFPVIRHLCVPIYENGKLALIAGIGNKDEPYDDYDALQLQLFSEEMWRIIIKNRNDAQIKNSLVEKEIMLKEIHHRVKNNLQIISALLNLKIISTSSTEVKTILEESRDRVHSMALVHKRLYSSADFSGINLRSYLEELSCMLLSNSNLEKNINIRYDIEELNLYINVMIPLGLIFNEMITNSIKHAFKGMIRGDIYISARIGEDGLINIKYGDDGIGFPDGKIPENPSTLGMQLITSLVEQIQGEIVIKNENGVQYEFNIKGN